MILFSVTVFFLLLNILLISFLGKHLFGLMFFGPHFVSLSFKI